MTPRFVHSFSTRPLHINCYGIDGLKRLMCQVWYFSLSVAYLRRLGAEIVLHTDSLGKAVLGHLPYTKINTTLDAMPYDIHPRFWAAGKFVALQNEAAPCVHIDGDVFIKTKKCLDRITELMESNDVVCQSTDAAKMYGLDALLFERDPGFCKTHHCEPDGRDAFNTGLLGLANDAVRANVVSNYIEIAKHFSNQFKSDLDSGNVLTPDLLAEQKMIEGYTRASGYKVDLLLQDKGDATNLGYQHVFTVDKFNCMEQCMTTLKLIAPDIYKQAALLAGV